MASAGLLIPASLPLLESRLHLRTQTETVDRLLCLNAVAAATYGFDRTHSLNWIREEGLGLSLTNREQRFLELGDGQPQVFQAQIEGMWALAWSLNLVPELDFWKDCDSNFAARLPNLKVGQRSAELRRGANLRSLEDTVGACDLAYCLHWAVRQTEIDRKQTPTGLKGYLVRERRRALEWLLSSEAWDSILLDT